METKKLHLRLETKCLKNCGLGWEKDILLGGFTYELSNIKKVNSKITFELYDDKGFIGEYIVSKKDFFYNFSRLVRPVETYIDENGNKCEVYNTGDIIG